MWKLRASLARFFAGRYGIDGYGRFLLVVYIIVAIVNVFVKNVTATKIIFAVQWLLLIYIIFRILSRNIYARQKENAAYNKLFYKVQPKFKNFVSRIKDLGIKRYRKCPNCKAVMRLPIKRGKHTVKCVSCGQQFKVWIII